MAKKKTKKRTPRPPSNWQLLDRLIRKWFRGDAKWKEIERFFDGLAEEEALGLLDRYLAENPGSRWFHLRRSEIHAARGDTEKVLIDLRGAIVNEHGYREARPEDVLRYCESAVEFGKTHEAVETLREVIATHQTRTEFFGEIRLSTPPQWEPVAERLSQLGEGRRSD